VASGLVVSRVFEGGKTPDTAPREADRRAAHFVAESGGRVVGALAVERLEWEPRLFGVEMARIPWLVERRGAEGAAAALLDAAFGVLASWGTRHASLLVGAEAHAAHAALEAAGWRCVDETIEYTWVAGRTTPRSPDPRLRLRAARDADRAPLRELASAAFAGSAPTRWHADPWLSAAAPGELYARWLDEAFAGRFADLVVVAEIAGRPVGFDTLRAPCERAAHGIAAVAPDCRGLGAQTAMLHHAAEWHAARGGRVLVGRVHAANAAMRRACARSGGTPSRALRTYHAWLGGAP
jgi:RimJ/RimL family protein N-acetyltransferase